MTNQVIPAFFPSHTAVTNMVPETVSVLGS